jgi:anti-sigma28 factor (negative regulator of flagellin synthesis)
VSSDGITVSISSRAKELSAASFDSGKVQQLRGAIQSNSYVVRSTQIAQSMLAAG